MADTNAVAIGLETSATFDYLLKFVYNEGEGGEQAIVLSGIWTAGLPLRIPERWKIGKKKYPYASQAHDSGTEKETLDLDIPLACQTMDFRYIEKQARQIKEFFDAAPSKAVNVLWIDSAGDLTGYVARVNQCKLQSIDVPRTILFRPPAIITLGLSSLETALTYIEPGDSSPSGANIYGSQRFRAETNDGSAVFSVVNDVTGKTLFVVDDQGNVFARGYIRSETDQGGFPT